MEGHVSMFTVAEVLNFPEKEPETSDWVGSNIQRAVAFYGPFDSGEKVDQFIERQRSYGVTNHFRIIKMLSAE